MKKKVFWIIYYAVTALLLAVAIIVFRKYIVLNWFSLFSVPYIAFDIFIAHYFQSPKYLENAEESYEQDVRWYQISRTLPSIDPKAEEYWDQNNGKRISYVFLGLIPIFIIFIFFFSNHVKALSGIFVMLLGVGIGHLVQYITTIKMVKMHNELRRKARKEQEKREELGGWK